MSAKSTVSTLSTREYRNAELGFSLRVPESWRDIAPDELATFNALLPEAQRSNAYIAGFVAAPQDSFGYPYLLVQHLRATTTGATWEDIEKGFGAERLDSAKSEVADTLGDLVKNFDLQTPRIEREHNRIIQVISGQSGGADATRFRGLTVLNLGRDRVIALHAYQQEQAFDAEMPVFAAVADSFRFAPGAEFLPEVPAPRGLGLVPSMMLGAVAGVIVAGVLVLVRAARRKSGKNA